MESGGNHYAVITVTSTGTYYWLLQILMVFNTSCLSVVVNPNPVVNLTGPTIVCLNTMEDYTTTNISGTSYFWTVDNGTIISGAGTNSINIMFSDTGQANVGVIVQDNTTSCKSQADISLTVLSAPTDYEGTDESVCFGSSVQLQAFGGTTYNWLPPTGLSNPNISNPVATPLVTTTYIVEVANGSCSSFDTIVVTVHSIPFVDAGPDKFINWRLMYSSRR